MAASSPVVGRRGRRRRGRHVLAAAAQAPQHGQWLSMMCGESCMCRGRGCGPWRVRRRRAARGRYRHEGSTVGYRSGVEAAGVHAEHGLWRSCRARAGGAGRRRACRWLGCSDGGVAARLEWLAWAVRALGAERSSSVGRSTPPPLAVAQLRGAGRRRWMAAGVSLTRPLGRPSGVARWGCACVGCRAQQQHGQEHAAA